MSGILFLIMIKLFITIIFLARPFLLWEPAKLDCLMVVSGDHTIIFRLYGVAMLALAVAYGGGALQASQGEFPWTIVWMGMVSNLGAGLVLLVLGRTSFLKVGAFVFLGIGFAFGLCALLPESALRVWA